MRLRIALLLMLLFSIGLFANSQSKKKKPGKPKIEEGWNAPPALVISSKKSHKKKMPVHPPAPIAAKPAKVSRPPKSDRTPQNEKA
jgi:hypothetical protein